VKLLIMFVAAMALTLSQTKAAIIGFDDFSLHDSDDGTPPVLVDSETIQFTTGPNQRRSLWFNARQDISQFTATFTYRATGIGASGNRQGLAFVIQDDLQGANTIGDPVGGLFGFSGLGYYGIEPSAAVTIETDTGPARTYTGYYTDGVFGGGSTNTLPINAFNERDIDVTISYDGDILSVGMVDGADVFPPRNYLIGSLDDVIGNPDAYIGFTASTANGGANQFISNFRFQNAVPEPGAAWLLIVALGASGMFVQGKRILARRRFR
jgi:hypothetical protein